MSTEYGFLYDPASAIRPFLIPGETLLWSGEPKKGIVFRRFDLFLIPFSLFWLGFSCLWVFMVYKQHLILMELFGSIFVFIGIIFVIGRFFIDAWWRSGTTYGITNQRVIVVRRSFSSKNMNATDIANINDVNISERPDGSGTLKFTANESFQLPDFFAKKLGSGAVNSKVNYSNSGAMFEMIPHVKTVYEILMREKSRITAKNDSGN